MFYHRDPCSLDPGMAAFKFPYETEAGEPCLVVVYTWDSALGDRVRRIRSSKPRNRTWASGRILGHENIWPGSWKCALPPSKRKSSFSRFSGENRRTLELVPWWAGYNLSTLNIDWLLVFSPPLGDPIIDTQDGKVRVMGIIQSLALLYRL